MKSEKENTSNLKRKLIPNLKFVENKILLQIIDNDERGEYTANNKQLMWDTNDDLVVKPTRRIKAGKRYKDYMESADSSFEDDQKFIGKLFFVMLRKMKIFMIS